MKTTRGANKRHTVLPWTNQHSLLDRMTHTQGKEKKKLNKKKAAEKKKDT
jgi:hypothetical protein